MSLILDGTNGVSDIDGSAATPAIRGTDANTGMFFPAADTIAFSEGGVESMRIDSSGNLGLGTTSPAFKLDVVGNTNTPVTLASQNSNSGVSATARFLAISDGGNAQLAACSSAYTDVTGAADSMMLNANSMSNGIVFATDGVIRMKLDTSGNLGIGTSSPTALLHVNGTARAASMSLNGVTLSDYNLYSGMVTRVSNGGGIGINSANATDNAYIYFGSGTSSGAQQSAAIGRIGGDVLAMFTASTERMRIDSSGRVTMPFQPMFIANGNQTTYVSVASGATIPLNTTTLNTGSSYNTSTNIFTAPVAGRYLFIMSFYMQSNGGNCLIDFMYNGALYQRMSFQVAAAADLSFFGQCICNMSAGDNMRIINNSGASRAMYIAPTLHTAFSGYLIG